MTTTDPAPTMMGGPARGGARVRAFWRTRLRGLWHGIRWPVLAIAGIVALVLGVVGFAQCDGLTLRPLVRVPGVMTQQLADLLYRSLQLFVLELNAGCSPYPQALEAARFLAVGVAGVAVLQALSTLLAQELQAVRLWFLSDHVVVCGLDRKGWLLVKGFHERGERVVGIDQAEGRFLDKCRGLGVPVLVGDATSRVWLRKARVDRARFVFAVTGDDAANADIAVHARELVEGRTGTPLTCIVHIVDPYLCQLLNQHEIGREKRGAFRLEYFNVFDGAVQALLSEIPVLDAAPEEAEPPHLLIVGVGRMGESLVVQAARRWRVRHGHTGRRLRLTLVDLQAERKCVSLYERYPRLKALCELMPVQLDVRSPEFEQGLFLVDARGRLDISAAFVCIDDDSLGLSTALALLHKVRGRGVPIYVRLGREAGLAALLGEDVSDGMGFAALHAFGLLDRTCHPDLLLRVTREQLAQALHEEYLRVAAAAGDTPATNAAMVPWSRLPEAMRESNRREADHIAAKLHAVGCGLGPLTDWDADAFAFTPDEVERLAEMEHARWLDEQRALGWTTGSHKDEVKRTNPLLVPWAELAPDRRTQLHNVIRRLPRLLADAGFQIYRARDRA
jgi:hypothetical protein